MQKLRYSCFGRHLESTIQRRFNVGGLSSCSSSITAANTKFIETPRINPVGIQYLSKSLHKQLFGNSSRNDALDDITKNTLVTLSQQHLSQNGLLGTKTTITEPISFDLPKLQGSSLDEHFQKIGQFVSDPYLSICENKFTKIIEKPKEWILKPGWYRYEPGKAPKPVPYPLEDLIVFDVECLYKISHYPTLAVALSDKAWYCWCSPYICSSEDPTCLIPLNTLERPIVAIGHNVGYDRSKVLEEYNFQSSKAFFMDTMSLHIASSGMCSRQKPRYLQIQKEAEILGLYGNELIDYNERDSFDDKWATISATNSLKDVAKLHCNIKLDKKMREAFDTEDKYDIINSFQELVNYCAKDVEVTSKVFDKVFPLFREKCPHPISFGALRFLGSCMLPVKPDNWKRYIETAEGIYQKGKKEIEDKIVEIVETVVKLKDDPAKVNEDPWYRQLDWNTKPLRLTKKGVPMKNQKLPGYPEWYKSMFKSARESRPTVSIRGRITPLLFKLTWEGFPVLWVDGSGWCFEVPQAQVPYFQQKNYLIAETEVIATPGHTIFRIPHPNGPELNCTNLLTKPFMHYMAKGILQSQYGLAREALEINSSGAYWTAARERIISQHVVSKKSFPDQLRSLDGKPFNSSNVGAILPKIIPMGTITRRAVESTWLTASNAKKNRIGSELKANIIAPDGYSFVGADVDSEELWIASLVGDSVFKLHGGTAIGWMCLEGTKSEGTDMHTKTANILGCSRNEAKIFNYGRIYGAGVRFASQLLKQFIPTLTEEQAKTTARKLYANTKGQTLRSELFKKFWFGGSESVVFNKLEHIAEQDDPRTPVLAAGITVSLMKSNLGKDTFLPSRINWTVQSSGVDYLHLLICSMNYLIERYRINARFCISIHDEVRYMVADKDKYRAAMALQISNLWTRAIFCEQMGIHDLPQNCAFFSAVDIDKVMRKEVDMDCVTPSNAEAIPHGETVNINDLLNMGTNLLGDHDNSVNIEKYSYQPRQTVLSYYNSNYSDEFLKFFLQMQLQTSRSTVIELQNQYYQNVHKKKLNPVPSEKLTYAQFSVVNEKVNAKATKKIDMYGNLEWEDHYITMEADSQMAIKES
ncbi:HEL064Cp [Eremothecium sinecaudum]|uniref:DNA polymerase gamma n=1 Tax=Eremothecium sinecaudum TaxID=45286 RepID=A0A0X8HTK5_9SACH|nr:HEL064Cp [Eremothecium sinecaudum]AMD21216.1 HEL064Cp [Eremothecium sinecaudum]